MSEIVKQARIALNDSKDKPLATNRLDVCNQQSKKNTPKFDFDGLILKELEETGQDFEKV